PRNLATTGSPGYPARSRALPGDAPERRATENPAGPTGYLRPRTATDRRGRLQDPQPRQPRPQRRPADRGHGGPPQTDPAPHRGQGWPRRPRPSAGSRTQPAVTGDS